MPDTVPATHREVRLAARPEGPLTPGHFRTVEVPVPDPGPGQVLVRNRLMSVVAVMDTLVRGDASLPMPPHTPGEVMTGPAIGTVTTAPGTGLHPGDLVSHNLGWREYAVIDESDAQRIDPGALPDPAAHLSQGLPAWLGIVRGAEVRPSDTVFVTAAAGGVGSLAGQFARLRGATRVIGSTSSLRKGRRLVDELGYDAVVLRDAGPIEDQLREAAPDGIDAVFDNVGGEQLLAALALARRGARIALVGTLSSQISGGFSSPVEFDTGSLILRGITVRGISGIDHLDAIPQWFQEFSRGLREGTLTFPHVRLPGIDQASLALCELLEGRHVGAVLVEL
ncbi:putative NADP-dependent oxidoreductase YfmJ [Streptomyces sp. YIM 130001]|uniref:MDR family NADP-dependent oxidoreductase n=1 Tax=Streptomyces sp. YIM 130001 TaxID=2259644 RepID=UPI000E64CEA8|nr:NADP-dependent oxidoreductase [Streptomyces sp. YIM 130001]RII11731.1 putative NADP-dependent oxidoreductase YfmJ [Streptomyces sp. YIM 130001]